MSIKKVGLLIAHINASPLKLLHPFECNCYYYIFLVIFAFFTVLFFFFFCRPDGQKKAYVRLAPDYDALDVANKVILFL